jgi:hypothetical protein
VGDRQMFPVQMKRSCRSWLLLSGELWTPASVCAPPGRGDYRPTRHVASMKSAICPIEVPK